MKQCLAVLGIMLLVTACSTTQSGVHKDFRFPEITNTGEGDVIIIVRVANESAADTKSGDADATNEFDTAMALKGATGAAGDNVEIEQSDANKAPTTLDQSKTDSDNPVDNSVTTTPVPIVTPKDPKTPGLGPVTESLFALEMVMTEEQDSPEMGFWFTDSELKVEWEGGFWEDKSDEDIAVKKTKDLVGNVMFDPQIPVEAVVNKATLTLVLEPHEGQAYGDTESIVEFRDMETGEVIKTFRSGDLIDDPGCAKHIPRCAFDFTEYVQGLR